MTLARFRYIVVEGPIGVGKTTLAKKLAAHLDATLLLEQPDAVPFLPQFYEDPARYALATQLSFLFQRIDQVAGLAQMDLFHGHTVSDFLFEKDPLFAEMILSAEELKLYSNIFQHVRMSAPVPDLVIYLQADVEVLHARVRSRSRDYEANMGELYLRKLVERYSRFFYDYAEAPVLMVNTENLDWASSTEDFELLLRSMANMRGSREYFNKR